MESLTTRVATVIDLDASIEVLREASNWLRGRGMPLWDAQQFNVSTLAPLIQRRQLLVVECASEVVAAAYRFWEDDEFWPERPSGEAAYLHKIAVRRAYAGRGIPKALIEWVAAESMSVGLKFIRLDCAPRPALLRIYESRGFVRVDEKHVGLHTVVRMELPLPLGRGSV